MASNARPYEVTSSKQSLVWWVIGGVTILALVGGLIWWSVANSNTNKNSYTFTSLITSSDVVLGNKDSKISLVIFEDYTCRVCKDNEPIFQEVGNTYIDKIEIVYKPVDILRQGGDVIARSAFAAHKQGKFKEYTSQVFARQEDMKTKRETTMTEIAQSVQLDMIKWNEDRNFNKEIIQKIAWNERDVQGAAWKGGVERGVTGDALYKPGTREKAKGTGITATPTAALVKDGTVVLWWEGLADKDTLTKRIETVLALQ